MTLVTLPVGRNDFSNSVENNRHFVKFTLCFFLLCVHGVCISCVLYYQLHFRKIVFTAASFFYCGACYVLFFSPDVWVADLFLLAFPFSYTSLVSSCSEHKQCNSVPILHLIHFYRCDFYFVRRKHFLHKGG